jgi:PTH1 family peptidyl-tRNA hydrolase
MKLIIGLGNPGFRYRKTRHNAGFLAVDYAQKNLDGFSKWKNKKNLLAEISENYEQNIILAKPQNYMNKSGEATKLLLARCLFPERAKRVEGPRADSKPSTGSGDNFKSFTVIHDDFDLPLGEFKLEQNRSSAGHRGVQSIIDALGTNEFWRLRIGIRPTNITEQAKAEDYVLKKFTREEKAIIEKIIPEAIKTLF